MDPTARLGCVVSGMAGFDVDPAAEHGRRVEQSSGAHEARAAQAKELGRSGSVAQSQGRGLRNGGGHIGGTRVKTSMTDIMFRMNSLIYSNRPKATIYMYRCG